MDTSAHIRLRLKSDGRVVEVMPDGRERAIEAGAPSQPEPAPLAPRSVPSARLAALAPSPREPRNEAAPRQQSRLAARLAGLAPAGIVAERTPPPSADAAYARQVRAATKLTQSEFAARIGVPIETVRNWEQGKRSPRGPARALLKVIEKAPDLVFAALAPARGR